MLIKNLSFQLPEVENYRKTIREIYPLCGEVSENIKSSKKIVVCFTNRSGSNYLCELMKNTGLLGNAQEYLNQDTVENIKEKENIDSFSEYFLYLYNNFATSNNVFSFQVGLHQLLYLLEINDELKLFDSNTEFIYISRNDSVMQAVSYYKAIETGSYTSLQAVQKQVEIVDYAKLESILEGLLKRRIVFDLIFNLHNLQPHRVFYEDLIKEPSKEIAKLMDKMKIEYERGASFKMETKLKKQSNSENVKWANVLRDTLKKEFILYNYESEQ